MCLREDTQKLLSYFSYPKWPEKGGALSLFIHNRASGYFIKKVQVNQEGLELNDLHQFLGYADDVTLLGEGINTRVKEHDKAIMAWKVIFNFAHYFVHILIYILIPYI